MFQPLKFDNHVVGFEKRTPSAIFFFGTRHCSREMLPQLYPDLQFSFLNQVHGTQVLWIETPASDRVADGHATRTKNLALVIKTADCLPILLLGDGVAMALHAGWRGLADQIINSAARTHRDGFHLGAIGPHISGRSFEVQRDVVERFESLGHKDAFAPHPLPNKSYVDLRKIALQQLNQHLTANLKIDGVEEDTFTSPLFHSYRRGKNAIDRQYSFVVLT